MFVGHPPPGAPEAGEDVLRHYGRRVHAHEQQGEVQLDPKEGKGKHTPKAPPALLAKGFPVAWVSGGEGVGVMADRSKGLPRLPEVNFPGTTLLFPRPRQRGFRECDEAVVKV